MANIVSCQSCGKPIPDHILSCPYCKTTIKSYWTAPKKPNLIIEEPVMPNSSENIQQKQNYSSTCSVTQHKENESFAVNVGGGIAMGIMCLVFGGIVCVIPIIGWILGPIIIFTGVISPLAGIFNGAKDSLGAPRMYYLIQGPCPYCSGSNATRSNDLNTVAGIDCPICKKRIVVRNGDFWKV